MPAENSTPEDAQPLGRSVNDQPLARKPAGAEQEESGQAEGEREEAPPAEEHQEDTPQPEAKEKEKGPVEKVLDKAHENGWVYDSVAQQVRERGLASKADEAINKARNMLTGG
jgi:hypothetical protein